MSYAAPKLHPTLGRRCNVIHRGFDLLDKRAIKTVLYGGCIAIRIACRRLYRLLAMRLTLVQKCTFKHQIAVWIALFSTNSELNPTRLHLVPLKVTS